MTMTSERAEAVDFVAPYFDQVCNTMIHTQKKVINDHH